MLRHSPQRISVNSPREGTRKRLHPVFEANHQRSTGRPPNAHGHGLLPPVGSHSPRIILGEPVTPAVQLYSVQCTTLDGPARRSDAIPHSGRTPNARENSRMPHVARESMFTLITSSLCHPFLPLIQIMVRSRPNQSTPLRPLRHVTNNGQDGAHCCQIPPDSHPVPVRASRTPGPSRQS